MHKCKFYIKHVQIEKQRDVKIYSKNIKLKLRLKTKLKLRISFLNKVLISILQYLVRPYLHEQTTVCAHTYTIERCSILTDIHRLINSYSRWSICLSTSQMTASSLWLPTQISVQSKRRLWICVYILPKAAIVDTDS